MLANVFGGTGSRSSSQPSSTPALNALSLVNQSAVVLPVALAGPESQAATAAPSSSSLQSAVPSAAVAVPASQSASTPTLLPSARPDLMIGGAADQFPSSTVFGAPAPRGDKTPIAADQQAAPGFPNAPVFPIGENLPAANQLSPSALPGALASLSCKESVAANLLPPFGPASNSPRDKNSVAANQLPPSGLLEASNSLSNMNSIAANQLSAPRFLDTLPTSNDNKPISAPQLSVSSLPDTPPPFSDKVPVAVDHLSMSGFPDSPASLGDKSIAAVAQQQWSANNQGGDPPADRNTIADIQIPVVSPASPNTQDISFLPTQMVSWQPAAPVNTSAGGAPSSPAAHFAIPQATSKAALFSAQLPAALPAILAPQASGAKNAPIAPAEAPTVVLPTNALSSNHSSSRDSSSNTVAQKSSDFSANPGPSVSRDASAFSQALATATDAKSQAVPSTANQASAIPAVSVPLSDHPVAPAASPLPSAPVNPPEPPMHSLDAAPGPTVSNAQISQNSNHSEMRIAMQSDKLGAVELRARVAGDEFGAAITVEKRDAHAALAVELPALQQALSDKHFRIDQITLLHGSLHSTTGEAGAQSHAQQGDRGAHRAQVAQSFLRDNSGAFVSFQAAAETRGIFDSHGRLSVQA